MAFLSNATGRVRRSGSNASMASATSALRMRGSDVNCSRISVRAVRSHNPSRKATVGSVAPSHLAPCLTRWRREGWHRLRNPLDHLGIRARLALGKHFLNQLDTALVSSSVIALTPPSAHFPRKLAGLGRFLPARGGSGGPGADRSSAGLKYDCQSRDHLPEQRRAAVSSQPPQLSVPRFFRGLTAE